jgi:PAS domain S-box-containing protein
VQNLPLYSPASEELRIRLRQQAAVAEMGQLALEGLGVDDLLEAAVVVLKNILPVDFTKVLELQPGRKKMLLRAGVGWNSDVVIGKATVDAGKNSQAGYTLHAYRPVIVDDLSKEPRFSGPDLLHTHGVQSGMSVIIRGSKQPYGILGVHSKSKQRFTQDDVNFLQAMANILAASIQRRETETQLLAHQEWLLIAQKAAQIGTFEWDLVTDLIIWTKEMEELYGLPEGTYDGTRESWNSYLHPDDRDRMILNANKAVAEKDTEYFAEFRIVTKPGKTRWVSLRASILYDKRKTRVPIRMVGVNLDITRRKEAEIHKDEFIGIISHELKTPVTSLKAYGQVLQRRFAEENNQHAVQQLAKMDFQLNKLSGLIGDLLDVTKIEAGRLHLDLQEFNIKQLIDEVIDEMQPTTVQHTIARVGRESGETPCTVMADRERVGQVLINFISNAIKYSPEAKKITVLLTASEDMVQIGVRDFGMGVAQADQGRIFERFFRAERPYKNSFPGIGLGLFISSEIIRRHGGRVWVDSRTGKGSTFWFELPLEQQKKTEQKKSER